MEAQSGDALDQLRAHLGKWYADYDFQALEICLGAVIAHFAEPSTQALWPFLVGAPRTGKTETILAFQGLPMTETMGDLTPKSFMSADPKHVGSGLLARMTKQGKSILLFKDFTTILSKNADELHEILASLREIADGELNRWTGLGQVPPWKGKLTMLAAVTPAIEHAWRTMQVLGPRFLFVRWPTPDPIRAGEAAQAQIGHEDEIHAKSQDLVRQVITRPSWFLPARLDAIYSDAVNHLAALTVKMRQHVTWNSHHTTIVEVDACEGSPAITKHLDLLIRTHAAIYRRESPTPADFTLARRVAYDSIPWNRRRILDVLTHQKDTATLGTIRKAFTDMSTKTVNHYLEELEEINVVNVELVEGTKWVELTPAIQQLLAKADLPRP